MKQKTLEYIICLLGNEYLYVDKATIKTLGAAFELLSSLADNTFSTQSSDTQQSLCELRYFANMIDIKTPSYVPANDENIIPFEG